MAKEETDIKDMKLYVRVERIYNELRELGFSETDALDPADVFRLAIVSTPAGIEVEWPSVAGRLYSVDRADALSPSGTAWGVAGSTDRLGTGAMMSHVDTNNAASRHYRVQVRK